MQNIVRNSQHVFKLYGCRALLPEYRYIVFTCTQPILYVHTVGSCSEYIIRVKVAGGVGGLMRSRRCASLLYVTSAPRAIYLFVYVPLVRVMYQKDYHLL